MLCEVFLSVGVQGACSVGRARIEHVTTLNEGDVFVCYAPGVVI